MYAIDPFDRKIYDFEAVARLKSNRQLQHGDVPLEISRYQLWLKPAGISSLDVLYLLH